MPLFSCAFKSNYGTSNFGVGNPRWVAQSIRMEGKPGVCSVPPGLVKALVLGDGIVSWSGRAFILTGQS